MLPQQKPAAFSFQLTAFSIQPFYISGLNIQSVGWSVGRSVGLPATQLLLWRWLHHLQICVCFNKLYVSVIVLNINDFQGILGDLNKLQFLNLLKIPH